MTYKQAWGEERVYFRDDAGRLRHMPVTWTSHFEPDVFQVTAAGRCRFRIDDLLRLVELLEGLRDGGAERKRS